MRRGQPESDLIGHTLASYRVLEALGSGGMGDVYLAEDVRLGRRVALKILPPQMAADAEKLRRFEREARAVASLSHPGIVVLHSIEEADGLRFLTMEHVEGETLNKAIPPRGFPLERLLPLAIALTDAVCAAHRQGILHRDLKPENVMLTGDGRLKVLDFGLAKLRPEGPDDPDRTTRETRSVTQDGWIVGTAAYMSPEQAQGLTVDQRSDIFSLGILLYEMATGERPFRGTTNLSVLASVLKDAPRPVSELRSDIPRPLVRMIQRALEKRPEERYQSATDLRRDLEDLKRDVDTGELRVAAKGARRTVAAPRTRRRRLGPDRSQADLDGSCAGPVLGCTPHATDLGPAGQADPLAWLRRSSRATVVVFVEDGLGLRDVLQHLALLRPGDRPASSLSARTDPGRWMRWGES
jgi:serine/threonine protein kinase